MRATVGDVELEYELIGDGPELVWLHGLSGSLEESRPLCERLAERYRVCWYSTRGHGRSTSVLERERYTYDLIAADLDVMLDHVGFERPLLAGGSHGANTILRHEMRYPGRARGLLLVAPGSNALRRPKRTHWALIRASVQLAQRHGDDGIVKAITGQRVGDPAADQQRIDAARTHDMPSVLAAMRFIADQQVVPAEVLHRIDVPTVVAAWARDPLLHSLAVAKRIAALIPDAEFEEIPRPNDIDMDSQAQVVAGLLDRLLARSPAAS